MCSRRRIAATVALVSFVAGCTDTFPLEPGLDMPIVEAVLNAAVDTQYVHVRSVQGRTRVASVEIGRSGTLAELPRRTFNGPFNKQEEAFVYAPDDYGRVVPGETYDLRVTLEDGRVVIGSTTVPPVEPTITVEWGVYEYGSDIRVEWDLVSGVDRYFVTIVKGSRVLLARFADSSFTVPGAAIDLFDGFSSSLKPDIFVTVSVADEHLRRYESVRTDPFSGSAVPMQFENAYGVFGAIVPIARTQLELTFSPSVAMFRLR